MFWLILIGFICGYIARPKIHNKVMEILEIINKKDK